MSTIPSPGGPDGRDDDPELDLSLDDTPEDLQSVDGDNNDASDASNDTVLEPKYAVDLEFQDQCDRIYRLILESVRLNVWQTVSGKFLRVKPAIIQRVPWKDAVDVAADRFSQGWHAPNPALDAPFACYWEVMQVLTRLHKTAVIASEQQHAQFLEFLSIVFDEAEQKRGTH